MIVRMTTLSVATLVASTAAIATADFQGFSIETSDSGMGLGTTYQIYADVDAGNQLNAVYGDGSVTLDVHVVNGSFYQNMFGGNTSQNINPARYGAFPSLMYDSWVTIGLDDQVGNALNNIGIDWSAFEGGGAIVTSDGSWFATPDDAQVFEVGGRVLIGQFTTTGDGVEGTINMQGKEADGTTNWNALGAYFNTVPAPGAIALLGLAGLVGRRRRS